jgi:molybdopterin synthase sulfur carrier subunit
MYAAPRFVIREWGAFHFCTVARDSAHLLSGPTSRINLHSMTVTALLFASYAEALGSDRVELALENHATVRDVVEHLRALPGGGALPPLPLVAVNLTYAAADQRVESGDEVAIIPPVAGG